MIRNYILVAIRNLWRNKVITVINLVGMAAGFGIFLTFLSWVRFDLEFDKFHKDIDQMYILNVHLTMREGEYKSERTGGIFATSLRDNFPQITSSCRISSPLEFELGVQSAGGMEDAPMKYFKEDEVLAVDTNFFQYFTFPLVKGDKNEAFPSRDQIVITESLARKLFGDEDPHSKEIRIGEGGYFRVSGVVEDPPEESSYQFHALLEYHIMEELGYPVDGHEGTIFYSHFKLSRGTDVEDLNRRIREYIGANYEDDIESYYYLGPFERSHLFGEARGYIGMYVNLVMAIVILAIACINFINLTTAFSSRRTKEIAIRKSYGAGKRQLIIQFLGETYLLLLLAIYLGFFIAEHLVPHTFRLFGVDREMEMVGHYFWLQVAVIFIITGFAAGLYPAIKIAGFNPLDHVSGKSGITRSGGGRSRKILIVVQFSFSVILILLTLFMTRQYTYMKETDLGFNRKDVLFVRTTGKAWENYRAIKQDLENLHYVEGVSTASSVPVMIDRGELDWGERESDHNKIAVVLQTDEDFLTTFEIGLRAGEFYNRTRDSLNNNYVVVNQSLVDILGWQDPVGRSFYLMGEDLQILGVTENINFFPFNLEIFQDKALIYQYRPVSDYIFVRINREAGTDQIAGIKEVFNRYNPGYEFNYEFVSDYEYDALENAEGMQFVFNLFSVVAIFIAAMGLIGLSLFNSSRRTKEVGIRKAMGAHTGVIMQLLFSEFLKLVVLANIIGIPIAYLALSKILRFFSYRVDLSPSIFLLVFLFSILVSLATVMYHAYRTARSNPVKSLRYE